MPRATAATAPTDATERRSPFDNPSKWEHAAEMADDAYYEIYARWRTVESQLELGDPSAALELRQIHAEVSALGMQLHVTRAERVPSP